MPFTMGISIEDVLEYTRPLEIVLDIILLIYIPVYFFTGTYDDAQIMNWTWKLAF
jgi:hypothetical protein